MKATLLRGENRTGATLAGILESGTRRDFRFAVAYARRAGAALLEGPMRKFLADGGAVQGVVGINQGNTSHQGLALLSEVVGDGLHLRCGRKGGAVFHPKLYFFGKTAGKVAPATAVVGSSNLTRGGLRDNEECDVLLEDFSPDGEFSKSVGEFWEGLRVADERFATVRATPEILGELLECGALVDETQTAKKRAKAPDAIERELSRILAGTAAPSRRFFAMTLSGFDVSRRSSDPVILIPIRARDDDPKFWFWPDFFVRELKLAGLYLNSSVLLDGETRPERARLYDYPRKQEFRLKSETVKRNAKEGDILVVRRDGDEMRLSVVRRGTPEHAAHERLLVNRVSPKKRYGYFDRL